MNRASLRLLAAFFSLAVISQTVFAQSIPANEAASAFAVARDLNERDAGQTWGMPVCGPLMFGDSDTNDVVANQADSEGKLQRSGGVWIGKLPKEVHVANTAFEWAGVRWTMVMWPLPGDTRALAQLLGHECYHRIQPALKLPSNDVMNSHLDGKDGRIWLLLEWRALERALMTSGVARKQAIADAIEFRRYRRSLIASAEGNENKLEMNEGLAEYTGVRLANANEFDRRAAALFMLRDVPRRNSLVRSFAYASGPAFGVLLDESEIAWRKTLTPFSDLGTTLAHAYKIAIPIVDEASALVAARRYGGGAVIASETTRANKLEKQLVELRRKFIDGPVLSFTPGAEFSFGFNPNGLVPLNENSVVYQWLRVSDTWGVLEASGALMVRENGLIKRVAVPAPKSTDGNKISGDNWTLELKPGFKIVAGERPGDLIVIKE